MCKQENEPTKLQDELHVPTLVKEKASINIGKAIQNERKKRGLTQNALADMLNVSFQAVSSWERGEYMPDTEKISKLSVALHVSPARFLAPAEEDESIAFETIRSKIFSEDRMYTMIKSVAGAGGFEETMRALPYMRMMHAGQYRKALDDSKVPYIYHPLTMACHALALGLREDNLLAAILLHDVMEDCGASALDLPVSDAVRETVVAVTKTKAVKTREGESPIQNEGLDSYYRGIEKSRDAMTVKVLDRCHNISNMATGFSKKRMAEYIEETEIYILPMLDKLRHDYPEFYNPAFLIKYQMLSVMESLKRTLQD